MTHDHSTHIDPTTQEHICGKHVLSHVMVLVNMLYPPTRRDVQSDDCRDAYRALAILTEIIRQAGGFVPFQPGTDAWDRARGNDIISGALRLRAAMREAQDATDTGRWSVVDGAEHIARVENAVNAALDTGEPPHSLADVRAAVLAFVPDADKPLSRKGRQEAMARAQAAVTDAAGITKARSSSDDARALLNAILSKLPTGGAAN